MGPLSGRSNYVVAFKIVSFTSVILGLALLSVCFWIVVGLIEREEEEVTNPTASGFRLIAILVNNQPVQPRSIELEANQSYYYKNNSNEVKIDELQEKFKESWENVSPYFQGACGLAVILGLIQVISCMVILSSSSKGASKPIRAKIWKLVHVTLAILLLVCFAIPVTIDKSEQDGGITNHLEALSREIERIKTDSILDIEDVQNMTLLYITLIVDASGILLLVIIAHMMLNCFQNKV